MVKVRKVTKKSIVPAALAKRAEQLVDRKRERVRREAAEAIALIKRRVSEIAEAFYDIGDALLRLSEPAVLAVVGHKTVQELGAKEFNFSARQVDELLAIRRRLTRGQALELGTQRRAAAFIDLADATPERDTPTGLLRSGSKRTGLQPRASARAADRTPFVSRVRPRRPTPRGRDRRTQGRPGCAPAPRSAPRGPPRRASSS